MLNKKQKQKNPCSSSKTSDCKRHPASSSCPCEDSAVGSHLLPPLEPPEPVKGLGLCAGNSRKEFLYSTAWACCLELSTGFLLPVVCPCAPMSSPPGSAPALGDAPCAGRCELGCGVSTARDLAQSHPTNSSCCCSCCCCCPVPGSSCCQLCSAPSAAPVGLAEGMENAGSKQPAWQDLGACLSSQPHS